MLKIIIMNAQRIEFCPKYKKSKENYIVYTRTWCDVILTYIMNFSVRGVLLSSCQCLYKCPKSRYLVKTTRKKRKLFRFYKNLMRCDSNLYVGDFNEVSIVKRLSLFIRMPKDLIICQKDKKSKEITSLIQESNVMWF